MATGHREMAPPTGERAPVEAVAPMRGGAEAVPGGVPLIRRLQAAAGNRAVGRILREPSFQLPLPWLLGGDKPPARPDAPLRLDDAQRAEAEARITAELQTATLLAQIARVRLGVPPAVGEPGGPDVVSGADPAAKKPAPPAATAPPPAAAPTPAPPAPVFTTPKPGEAGDLMDALSAHPAIAAGMDRVKDEALRAFRLAPPGQVRLAIVSGITFSLLAVGGAAATPGGRELLGRLSGTRLPVPGVSWLGVEFNSQGPNHILGLHVDVGALLPKSLGFGPAGPGQGPVPLTPGTGPGNF